MIGIRTTYDSVLLCLLPTDMRRPPTFTTEERAISDPRRGVDTTRDVLAGICVGMGLDMMVEIKVAHAA